MEGYYFKALLQEKWRLEKLSTSGLNLSLLNHDASTWVLMLRLENLCLLAQKPLAGFLCSANTILNVLNGPSEQVLLQLLYSNCVPRLTYACEIRKHTVGCV